MADRLLRIPVIDDLPPDNQFSDSRCGSSGAVSLRDGAGILGPAIAIHSPTGAKVIICPFILFRNKCLCWRLASL